MKKNIHKKKKRMMIKMNRYELPKKFDYKNSNGRKLNFNKIKISDWSKKMKEIRNRKLKSHKEIF